MQSAINCGLKQKVLEHYKREIIQTYGFTHLITMSLLEKSGLIKIQVNIRLNISQHKTKLTYLKNIFRQTQEAMQCVVVC